LAKCKTESSPLQNRGTKESNLSFCAENAYQWVFSQGPPFLTPIFTKRRRSEHDVAFTERLDKTSGDRLLSFVIENRVSIEKTEDARVVRRTRLGEHATT